MKASALAANVNPNNCGSYLIHREAPSYPTPRAAFRPGCTSTSHPLCHSSSIDTLTEPQSQPAPPDQTPHHASTWSPPIHTPPHVPSLQRRITTPIFGRTPVPGSALHRHPHCATTDHARPRRRRASGQIRARCINAGRGRCRVDGRGAHGRAPLSELAHRNNHIAFLLPGFDSGAHPGHRRVPPNPHCVANRLQFFELTFCIPVRYNA